MTEHARQGASRQPPRTSATAGDVMRPALTAVEPNGHVAAAANLMKHTGATALVVVDDEERKSR